MTHERKLKTRHPTGENHLDVTVIRGAKVSNRYRQILQEATETSPFRSLTARREREKAKRQTENHA